ncbi:hypothetical protein [Hypericibacter sp.]|uniref:hypothetical protein n=1 Tax=Hypericibacter sp. TaxID=2705401 RepID=UPI003D6CBE8F
MRTARGLVAALFFAVALGGCAMSGEAGRDRWDSDLAPAIVTTPDIAQGKAPILWVVHDPYPFGWIFYGPSDDLGPRPAMIAKEEALRIDPSLAGIEDLPVGWQARRASVQDKWTFSALQGTP